MKLDDLASLMNITQEELIEQLKQNDVIELKLIEKTKSDNVIEDNGKIEFVK